MAIYRVQFICDECGETHPVPGLLNLDDGPAVKASIGATYNGRDLPLAVAKLRLKKIYCPTTGRETRQTDIDQIYLVRIAR